MVPCSVYFKFAFRGVLDNVFFLHWRTLQWSVVVLTSWRRTSISCLPPSRLLSLAYACDAATPQQRNQMLCGGKQDHLQTCIPGSCQRGLGGSTDAQWVMGNPTGGDWLHIGQRLSGNGSECTTPVWAGCQQARERLGHR